MTVNWKVEDSQVIFDAEVQRIRMREDAASRIPAEEPQASAGAETETFRMPRGGESHDGGIPASQRFGVAQRATPDTDSPQTGELPAPDVTALDEHRGSQRNWKHGETMWGVLECRERQLRTALAESARLRGELEAIADGIAADMAWNSVHHFTANKLNARLKQLRSLAQAPAEPPCTKAASA